MKISEDFLGQVLSQAPSSETILLLLKELMAQGSADKAIREAIRALGRFPDDIRIRTLLAEACLRAGWLSRAESEVEKAAAQLENLIPVYKLQALIYSTLNRTQEALRCLQTYQAHRPDDLDAAALIQRLKPAQEPQQVTRAPAEAPAETLHEGHSLGILEIATPTLAEVYLAQGQIQEAVSTYEKVLVQNPEAAQSRKRLEDLKAMLSPASAAEPVESGAGALAPDPSESATPAREGDDPQALTIEPGHSAAVPVELVESGGFAVDLADLGTTPDDPDAERLRRKKEKLIHVLESWKDSMTQPPASS